VGCLTSPASNPCGSRTRPPALTWAFRLFAAIRLIRPRGRADAGSPARAGSPAMSTVCWQARRLPIPAAWPVRSSPAAHPWAIISAGLAPMLLTGAYLISGILQPASYSPVRTTISAMAGQAGTDRWVMTGGIFLVGGRYLVTGAGLTGVRASARTLLAVAGLAGIGIAASPEPARGTTPRHLAWTVLGAVTITVWPAFAAPARLPAAADPGRLRLRRRHRRLRSPARLAARRNPERQRPGPGRAADVIDPDLLAVHRRRRPAPHPAPPDDRSPPGGTAVARITMIRWRPLTCLAARLTVTAPGRPFS
jgi:hypothetical protein